MKNVAEYRLEVKNPMVIKKSIGLNGYTRAAPAIECDDKETLEMMRETLKIYDDDKVAESQLDLGSAFWFSIVTIGLLVGGLTSIGCCATKCIGRDCVVVVCPTLVTCIGAGASLSVIAYSAAAKSSFEEDKVLIEDLYGNAECGDPISSEVGSQMYDKVQDRSDKGIAGAAFLNVFGVMALLQCLVAFVLVIGLCLAKNVCNPKKDKKSKDDNSHSSDSSSD